jgi:hypothetical protein
MNPPYVGDNIKILKNAVKTAILHRGVQKNWYSQYSKVEAADRAP